MSIRQKVSGSVIARLPRYHRFLGILRNEQKKDHISSGQLSERMGLTASQIRQDLNCFGEFGQQGYGYNVAELQNAIGEIIGLDSHYPVILIGAGNLGKAIALHVDFYANGFDLKGIFDIDPALIGQSIGSLPVRHISGVGAFCKENGVQTAVLCIPENTAPQTVRDLKENGVNNFWNFSHYGITDDFPDANVQNVHLNDSLMTLCYNITNKGDIS